MSNLRDRIETLLADVAWQRIEHDAGGSSAEIAHIRGTSLAIGGKTLLLKIGKRRDFGLFVIGAAEQSDNRAIRHHLGVQRLRFATREELLDLTGLVPGTVPPFGAPIFDLPLYADAGVVARDRIAFTLGVPDVSGVMATSDWRRIANPDVFSFSQSETRS